MPHDPVVFISSTSDDLKEYREQAARAARASGFSPRMMEYFPATGDEPSLQVCRKMVAEAEVNGEYRVVRGGSWYDDYRYVRASVRDEPTYRVDLMGFRCVREL